MWIITILPQTLHTERFMFDMIEREITAILGCSSEELLEWHFVSLSELDILDVQPSQTARLNEGRESIKAVADIVVSKQCFHKGKLQMLGRRLCLPNEFSGAVLPEAPVMMGTLAWSVARCAYFAKWFARLLHGSRTRAVPGACIVA
jgi:hypothetical protein